MYIVAGDNLTSLCEWTGVPPLAAPPACMAESWGQPEPHTQVLAWAENERVSAEELVLSTSAQNKKLRLQQYVEDPN